MFCSKLNIKIKKAAMFGLDARIALAIFASLSLISGAVLFKAAQNAKATALIVQLKEIETAWDEYLIDTGNYLPELYSESCGFDCLYELENLLSNTAGVSKWKGPYLQIEVDQSWRVFLNYYALTFIKADKTLVWGADLNWNTAPCIDDDSCSAWILLGGSDSLNYFDIIDDRIDGGDGAQAGDFRWLTEFSTGIWKNSVFLRIRDVKK